MAVAHLFLDRSHADRAIMMGEISWESTKANAPGCRRAVDGVCRFAL